MSLAPGLNADRVLLVMFCFLAATAGIVGNLFIMGAMLVEKKLRFAGSVFVVNLAFADLCVNTSIFPMMALNLIHEGNVLSKVGCDVAGIIACLGYFSSTFNIALVAVDRYFCVCNEPVHRRYFSLRKVIVMASCSWIFAFMLLIPNIGFNIGPFFYDQRYDVCTVSFPKDHVWVGIGIVSLAMQLPIVVCCFCYYKIAKTVWSAKRKIRSQKFGSNTLQDKSSFKQSDIELYRTLFVIFALFLLCLTPFGVCQMLVDTKTVTSLPEPLIRTFVLLGGSNSVINSFVYCFTNKNFKRGYVTLITLIFGPICRLLRPWWQSLAQLCGIDKWRNNQIAKQSGNAITVNVLPVEMSTAVTDLL